MRTTCRCWLRLGLLVMQSVLRLLSSRFAPCSQACTQANEQMRAHIAKRTCTHGVRPLTDNVHACKHGRAHMHARSLALHACDRSHKRHGSCCRRTFEVGLWVPSASNSRRSLWCFLGRRCQSRWAPQALYEIISESS